MVESKPMAVGSAPPDASYRRLVKVAKSSEIADWCCAMCGKLPEEPVNLGNCKHCFCDQHLQTAFCPRCAEDITVYEISESLPDVRGELSSMFLHLMTHRVPVACDCGTWRGYINEVQSHATQAKEELNAHKQYYVESGEETQTLHETLLYLTELFLRASTKVNAVLQTRVCGLFVVYLAFDPEKDLTPSASSYCGAMLSVKQQQVVEVLAHVKNDLYGFVCVKLRSRHIHKWIPTACIYPPDWSRQSFVETLNSLKWQNPVAEEEFEPKLILRPLACESEGSTWSE